MIRLNVFIAALLVAVAVASPGIADINNTRSMSQFKNACKDGVKAYYFGLGETVKNRNVTSKSNSSLFEVNIQFRVTKMVDDKPVSRIGAAKCVQQRRLNPNAQDKTAVLLSVGGDETILEGAAFECFAEGRYHSDKTGACEKRKKKGSLNIRGKK